MQSITGTTKLLGVIGHPVEHSLSPLMHNAAIAQLGVDYVYLPLSVAPENLEAAMAGFAAIGLQGFNITIPHKQAILPFLSAILPVAQSVGAVNTVWRTDTGWVGTNTDVEGFLAPLRSIKRKWKDAVAVILGAGGSARAVVAGIAQLGCAEIHVVGRDVQKLEVFQAEIRHLAFVQNPPLPMNLYVHIWDNLRVLLPQAGLLVNTTPLGMYPDIEKSPLNEAEMAKLAAGTLVYDLIYNPNPTQFLKGATKQGCIAIDGLEMLIGQGAAALELWLKQPVPVDVMRQSLRQHLGIKN